MPASLGSIASVLLPSESGTFVFWYQFTSLVVQ